MIISERAKLIAISDSKSHLWNIISLRKNFRSAQSAEKIKKTSLLICFSSFFREKEKNKLACNIFSRAGGFPCVTDEHTRTFPTSLPDVLHF